jgi:hypothetical protein
LRASRKDLEALEERVNALLKRVRLHVCHRNGYTAIDVVAKDGRTIDTLTAGLTMREAYELLAALERSLALEHG